jgi:hypothetical protein
LIGCTARFKKLYIEIKDSFHLISMPLKKFSKVFGLPFTKEIMPYDLYKKETIEKRFINIQYVLDNFIDKNDHKQFLDNIEKWKLQKDDTYDILEYSSRYCEIDCKVLCDGYNTFNKWMKDGVNIDINSVMTIASLAHKYFVNTGCYNDVYSLSGIPQMFIQGSVIGGRTMVSNNTKISIKEDINDFDAVSLYPSAMYRMDGFLKGKPKVITDLSYDFIKKQDGYFVDIVIKSVGKTFNFPLMSSKNEDGIRMFSNDMIGKTLRVDKYTLEDLIDTFVESAMGKYGRFTLDEETKTIQLSNLSELDMKGLVNTVRESFVQMSEQLDPSDTDLLNIRDEMLGELNKLSYLLTLE